MYREFMRHIVAVLPLLHRRDLRVPLFQRRGKKKLELAAEQVAAAAPARTRASAGAAASSVARSTGVSSNGDRLRGAPGASAVTGSSSCWRKKMASSLPRASCSASSAMRSAVRLATSLGERVGAKHYFGLGSIVGADKHQRHDDAREGTWPMHPATAASLAATVAACAESRIASPATIYWG